MSKEAISNELPDDNIAVRCPHCRGIVYIAVNIPGVMDAAAIREVADMVIEGFSVEHMTLAQFRKDLFGHQSGCKPPGQLELVPSNGAKPEGEVAGE